MTGACALNKRHTHDVLLEPCAVRSDVIAAWPLKGPQPANPEGRWKGKEETQRPKCSMYCNGLLMRSPLHTRKRKICASNYMTILLLETQGQSRCVCVSVFSPCSLYGWYPTLVGSEPSAFSFARTELPMLDTIRTSCRLEKQRRRHNRTVLGSQSGDCHVIWRADFSFLVSSWLLIIKPLPYILHLDVLCFLSPLLFAAPLHWLLLLQKHRLYFKDFIFEIAPIG